MIDSQDKLNPCNDGKRSSDVLLATVEKCERLQKQLDIAIKALDSLQGVCFPQRAEQALREIKELDN